MRYLLPGDWKMFEPSISPLEIFIRGSIVYLALLFMLRLVLKREAGTVGITDLLVIVLIADAPQNAMAGGYKSVPDGLLLVGTVVFWSYALDWLGFRFPAMQSVLAPSPLLLVQDGRMLRRNMRRELITEGELMSHLRLQGMDDVLRVKQAYMEPDGQISVVTYDGQQKAPPMRRLT